MAASPLSINKTSTAKGKRSKRPITDIEKLANYLAEIARRGLVNFTTIRAVDDTPTTSTANKDQESPVSFVKITFHTCGVCGKSYISRATLDDHKSSNHARLPITAVSSDYKLITTVTRVDPGFDLNLPPAPEIDLTLWL